MKQLLAEPEGSVTLCFQPRLTLARRNTLRAYGDLFDLITIILAGPPLVGEAVMKWKVL